MAGRPAAGTVLKPIAPPVIAGNRLHRLSSSGSVEVDEETGELLLITDCWCHGSRLLVPASMVERAVTMRCGRPKCKAALCGR